MNGVKHGKGRCTDANGNVYDGAYIDGKPHGFGKYNHADGDIY